MNSTSVAVEGRAPSRRKSLCGIPHNDFYADSAIMPTTRRAGGCRGWSARVAAGETVGIITGLGGRRGGRRVGGSGPEESAGRADALRARVRFDHIQLTRVDQQRVQRARRTQLRPALRAPTAENPSVLTGGRSPVVMPSRSLRWLRSASSCRCFRPPRPSNQARTESEENLARARPATRSGCWFVASTCLVFSPRSGVRIIDHNAAIMPTVSPAATRADQPRHPPARRVVGIIAESA